MTLINELAKILDAKEFHVGFAQKYIGAEESETGEGYLKTLHNKLELHHFPLHVEQSGEWLIAYQEKMIRDPKLLYLEPKIKVHEVVVKITGNLAPQVMADYLELLVAPDPKKVYVRWTTFHTEGYSSNYARYSTDEFFAFKNEEDALEFIDQSDIDDLTSKSIYIYDLADWKRDVEEGEIDADVFLAATDYSNVQDGEFYR